MYPIKFKAIHVPKAWGSESWELVDRKDQMSIVENGPYKGLSLEALKAEAGEQVFGRHLNGVFPLLVKFIDAKEKLSIQVHPSDAYSQEHEKDLGKTEAWYIVDAAPNAEIVIGGQGLNRESLVEATKDHSIEDKLSRMKVKKGDLLLIPCGLIHAIYGDIRLAEIQQNSDVTYRIYDYGRGRPLHLEQALEVIDFTLEPIMAKEGKVSCDYFSLEVMSVDQVVVYNKEKNVEILCGVEGTCTVVIEDVKVSLHCGETVLIPASASKVRLEGQGRILRTRIPE